LARRTRPLPTYQIDATGAQQAVLFNEQRQRFRSPAVQVAFQPGEHALDSRAMFSPALDMVDARMMLRIAGQAQRQRIAMHVAQGPAEKLPYLVQ
jgi:hypothetical protein